MPARVAVFLPSLNGGGAQRALLTLTGSLAERGYAVDLVLTSAAGEYLGDKPHDVRLVDLAARRTALSLRGLVRYLRAERPPVLLAAMPHANLVALAARALAGTDTRVVVSERNTLSLSAANPANWRERVMPAAVRWSYPRADAIIAVSHGVAQDLCRTAGLDPRQVRVVYNPVVTPQLLARMNDPFEHAWFAQDAPPVVVGAGRLTAQKDFATLIRAFARLRARRQARLVILGEGEERPALEALVAELGLAGDVSLPGFAANPWVYMRRAAVFALSSRWEGLPGVLIEALTAGARVVSTDCPHGPAEILENGRWGRLVPVADPDSLAAAIDAALDSPHDPQVGEHLRKFTVEAATEAYLDALFGRGDERPVDIPLADRGRGELQERHEAGERK